MKASIQYPEELLLNETVSLDLPDRTPFLGRKLERASLWSELQAGGRLLTITGPAGMGKTRLARQLALDAVPNLFMLSEVRFCTLSSCRNAADLQAAVAEAMGYQGDGAQLTRALASKGRLLMILDNLEPVDSIRQLMAEWFDHCRDVSFVITSIIPLELEMEARFELGPLDAEDAMELYLDRAHRAWADRRPSGGEQQAVRELVSRLDRIPLALELAAARVRVLPPQALLSRMDQRFEILRLNRPGRHSSLFRAIELTWELLSEVEREALARVSIFEGGFTLEAAGAILGTTEIGAIELVDALRAKALVQLDEEEARFHTLESVKAFASLELERLGLLEETWGRHARFYVEHGERHAVGIVGAEPAVSVRWLRVERANLLAILRREQERCPEAAARAGLVLAPLLALEGIRQADEEVIERTIAAARAAAQDELLVQALSKGVASAQRFGWQAQTSDRLEEGLKLATSKGFIRERGELLLAKGTSLARAGKLPEAVLLFEEAIELGREHGDGITESIGMQCLATYERGRGEHERAAALYERALSIIRSSGRLRHEGVALGSYAVVLVEQGRFREARRALEEALAIARRLESTWAESSALVALSGLELVAGEQDRAEALARRALEPERIVGNLRGEAVALGNLGVIALGRDEPEEAERALIQCISLLEASRDHRMQAAWLCFLAAAQARLGRWAESERSLGEARELAALGDTVSAAVAELIDCLLCLRAARGRGREEARAVEERARTLLERKDGAGARVVAARLLRQELERREASDEEQLLVGPGGAWFKLPGCERIDLRRRAAARRMFEALVEQRLIAPGVGLCRDDLFLIGWEGSRADPRSAATRVYNEIRTLRSLGLASALLNQAGSYLLNPELPVVRAD